MKSRGERYFVKLAHFDESMYNNLEVEPINSRLKNIINCQDNRLLKGCNLFQLSCSLTGKCFKIHN